MVFLPFLRSSARSRRIVLRRPGRLVLVALFFAGWTVNGMFPIFMATIPSERFRPLHHATVLGLAMGACEILGGVFGPPVAGLLNDTFGVDTFLWMLMVLAVISGFVAMGLGETAPTALAAQARHAPVVA